VQIRQITASNVFRYDDFNLKFDNKIYLVLGKVNGDDNSSNTAGKTSIIDIILYGLYGKTLRKGISDISKMHCGNMKVTVDFDDKTIIRTKTNGDNNVDLFIDGEKQIGLKRELQSFVSNSIDDDLFKLITMFTSKNNFFVLNDTEKKDLLISLTKNDNIDKIYKYVNADLSQIKNNNVDVLIKSYESTLSEKEEVEAKYNKLKKKYKKYEEYEEGISQYNEYIKIKETLLEEYNYDKKKFEELKTKGKRLNKIVKGLEKIDLDGNLETMSEYKNTINKNEDKIEEIQEKIDMIKDGNKCPTCRQMLKNKDKILQNFKDDVSDCNQQIKIAKELLSEEKIVYMKAKDEKSANDDMKMELNRTKGSFDLVKLSVNGYKNKLKGLDEQYEEYFKYEDFEITLQDISNVKLQYGEYKEKVNNLDGVEEKLSEIKRKKKKMDKTIIDLEEIKKIFSKDGLKQFIIQQTTDFLEDRINDMVSKVFEDMSIKIRLDFTEKRNMMNIDVSREGEDTIYSVVELSGAEQATLEIIFQIALNDLFETVSGDSVNFMIFDEVFDKFDKNNVDKIPKILKVLEDKEKMILIISHNPSVKEHFDNIITIEKEDGNSKLIQGVN